MRASVDGEDGVLGPLRGARSDEEAGDVILAWATACSLS